MSADGNVYRIAPLRSNYVSINCCRTLAMVMIYLKVFSWWRRVKARRGVNRAKNPLKVAERLPANLNRPIYASDPDLNEYVVLVFVHGVRGLPKNSQTIRLIAECGSDAADTNLSAECSAGIVLHAAKAVSDISVRILGSGDDLTFSTRVALPLPSTTSEPLNRPMWQSSDMNTAQLNISVVKLKFRDIANVVSNLSDGNGADGVQRLVNKLESALTSIDNDDFKTLGPRSGKGSLFHAEMLVGMITGQALQEKHARTDAEVRIAELESQNASLEEENRSLRNGESSLAQSDSRGVNDNAIYEKRIRDQQKTIDELLQKEQALSYSLKEANDSLTTMRELTGGSGEEKDNKIYELNRHITGANDLNKEHASALSIAAKKLVRLQETLEVYRHTMRDVSRALGSTLNGLLTLPVAKEELENMHSSALDTTPEAPDAVLTLRISERTSAIISSLDQEVQNALCDVSPRIREMLKQIPLFEDGLVRHNRSIEMMNSEANRLMAAVEDACTSFDFELSTIHPEEL